MISLEYLGDGSRSERNFEKLMSLVLDTGGVTAGIRFGVQTFTFTASAASPIVAINHGLGKVPVGAVVANGYQSGVVSVKGYYEPSTMTSTTFRAFGFADAAWTGSIALFWVVIG